MRFSCPFFLFFHKTTDVLQIDVIVYERYHNINHVLAFSVRLCLSLLILTSKI